MRIVLTGGGTGGHVIPNVAVIEGLKKVQPGVEILYIGSIDGVERRLIEKLGVRYEGVPCGKLRRYFSWENFVDAFKVPVGVLKARKLIRDFEPEVIFSKGGYVSVPVVLASGRVPLVIHESDVSPGMATRVAMKRAKKICLSFEESREHIAARYKNKVVVTGAPVRSEILEGSAEAAHKLCGFDKHRPVLLVMGGSLGAAQINDFVRGSLDELLKRFQVVHLVGRGNLDIGLKKRGYKQFEYLDEQMKDIYASCEMAVTRGGANSLLELAVLGKKALVIPLGSAASRGEQRLNAEVYAKKMGWSVLSGETSSENFVRTVEMAYANSVSGGKVQNGVKKVLDIILNS